MAYGPAKQWGLCLGGRCDILPYKEADTGEAEEGALKDTRFRVGVRNLFNELAPLADQTYGYIGDLYSNRGRQIYASISKRF